VKQLATPGHGVALSVDTSRKIYILNRQGTIFEKDYARNTYTKVEGYARAIAVIRSYPNPD
jgi:hypothetical protein